MSPPKHPHAGLRRVLRLLGLVLVLGGLIGMHGLEDHAGRGMDTVAHAVMPPEMHGAATVRDVLAGSVRATAAVTSMPYGGSSHAAMSMAGGMCLAVLALSLLLLALGLIGRQARPLMWLTARPVRAPGVRGRDPDPPSLIRLSIQRC